MRLTVLFAIAALFLFGCGVEPTTDTHESAVKNAHIEKAKDETCKVDPACDPKVPTYTETYQRLMGAGGCESYWLESTEFKCKDGVIHHSYAYVFFDLDKVFTDSTGKVYCVFQRKSWLGSFKTGTPCD